MAFRSMTYMKTVANHLGGTHPRAGFDTSAAPTIVAHQPNSKLKMSIKGDYVPVYVALGLIMLAGSFGVHTAMQQLRYSPNVQVSKNKREKVPEVEEPDHVVDEADKFLKNSLFRKVAHIQDYDRYENIDNPIHGDVYSRPAKVETLKSVGVDPSFGVDRKRR